jgi:hypothetical protein
MSRWLKVSFASRRKSPVSDARQSGCSNDCRCHLSKSHLPRASTTRPSPNLLPPESLDIHHVVAQCFTVLLSCLQVTFIFSCDHQIGWNTMPNSSAGCPACHNFYQRADIMPAHVPSCFPLSVIWCCEVNLVFYCHQALPRVRHAASRVKFETR